MSPSRIGIENPRRDRILHLEVLSSVGGKIGTDVPDEFVGGKRGLHAVKALKKSRHRITGPTRCSMSFPGASERLGLSNQQRSEE